MVTWFSCFWAMVRQEHSGGKYGWSKADHIIVAREGVGQELVEGRRGKGQAVPFQVMLPPPHKTPPLNSISSMSESLQDTS